MSHNSKSFSRIEPTRSSPLRSRASTLSHGPSSEVDNPLSVRPGDVNGELQQEDVFEKKSAGRGNTMGNARPVSPRELPDGFDDIPIELISLIDRYVDGMAY